MEHVWRRAAWLWPLFWLLARARILFPETGTDVPASMTVTADRDRDGSPYQTWRRTFRFRTPRHFDATIVYDRRLDRVVEWLGGASVCHVFEIVWEVRFHPPATIEIVTAGAALRLGDRRWWLPRWLCVAVRAVERADPGRDDLIDIDLRVMHPLVGPLFGYTGTFQVRRIGP